MIIIPCSSDLLRQAELLVHRVFPSMSLVERLSFVVIKRPQSLMGRLLMKLAGIKDVVAFDVFHDDAGKVIGKTGLYRYRKDATEALWVAWFCVAPETRGMGVGQKLIEHTVQLAITKGYQKLRLYTTTDPNEEAAQRLYEKNGFQEVRRNRGLFFTKIFREKAL